MDFILHIIGLCPDSYSHFDLINLVFNYYENNINFKKIMQYLKYKLSYVF